MAALGRKGGLARAASLGPDGLRKANLKASRAAKRARAAKKTAA
jgi:hypothetical protein